MTILIELLKIFISWPFVILLLGLAFGFTFRSEIAQFLRNIGSIKFPGGAEIQTNQNPPSSSEKPEKEVITLTEDEQKIIREHIENLTKEAKDAKQEKENLLDAASTLLSEKSRESRYWRFMYLSVFLVPMTKLVLRWYTLQTTPPTKEYYNEAWKTLINDPKQREVILMVLLHHGLLESKGHVIQVTQDGLVFLNFIGKDVNTTT